MKKLNMFITLFGILFFVTCANSKKTKNANSKIASEWRDNNAIDSASFYSTSESCSKIIGKLKIKSRLHKNLLKKGVFEGGMSSRWFEIRKDSIFYFAPNGEIADRGKCNCKNGVLKVDWHTRFNRPMEYKIHFNSSDFVELRYYDFPFSFDTFEYDTTQKPTNPTKLIGVME